jgi:hypothetical protein
VKEFFHPEISVVGSVRGSARSVLGDDGGGSRVDITRHGMEVPARGFTARMHENRSKMTFV